MENAKDLNNSLRWCSEIRMAIEIGHFEFGPTFLSVYQNGSGTIIDENPSIFDFYKDHLLYIEDVISNLVTMIGLTYQSILVDGI